MSLPPGAGRRLPPPPIADRGPLPVAHTDVSQHLSDVAGPPAPAQRAPDAPMAGPTVTEAPRPGAGKVPTRRAGL